jgi:hypothetical protein
MDSSSTNGEVGCNTARGSQGGQIVTVARNTKNCAGSKKMSAKVFGYTRTTRTSSAN